jgi:uncharacterized membrane protein
VLVFVVAVAFVRRSGGSGRTPSNRSPGFDVLDARYAKGEIQRDEYLQKRRDLGA